MRSSHRELDFRIQADDPLLREENIGEDIIARLTSKDDKSACAFADRIISAALIKNASAPFI